MKNMTKRKPLFAALIALPLLLASCGLISNAANEIKEIKDTLESTFGNDAFIREIKLDKSEVSMNVGEVKTLNISVTPERSQKGFRPTWTYDKSVIDVDADGSFGITIKAVQEGHTKLRCSYKGVDAVCAVSVRGFVPDFIESFYLDKTLLPLKCPNSEIVKINIVPLVMQKDVDVRWDWDDKMIALDTSNPYQLKVTGKKVGKTTITGICKNFKTTCDVELTSDPIIDCISVPDSIIFARPQVLGTTTKDFSATPMLDGEPVQGLALVWNFGGLSAKNGVSVSVLNSGYSVRVQISSVNVDVVGQYQFTCSWTDPYTDRVYSSLMSAHIQ